MLGLYLDTIITSHKFGILLSKPNELTVQKELQNVMTNNVFLTKKSENKTKQKSKHKLPCQSRELNPGPLTTQSDALPLHH